jgi:hypothetical protein
MWLYENTNYSGLVCPQAMEDIKKQSVRIGV